MSKGHLTKKQIINYVAEERKDQSIEKHLSDCEICRKDMAIYQTTLTPLYPKMSKRREKAMDRYIGQAASLQLDHLAMEKRSPSGRRSFKLLYQFGSFALVCLLFMVMYLNKEGTTTIIYYRDSTKKNIKHGALVTAPKDVKLLSRGSGQPLNRELLGYATRGAKKFRHRIWEGAISSRRSRQVVRVQYRGDAVDLFAAKYKKLFSGSLADKGVSKINLVMSRPVEYRLKNPSPSTTFAGKGKYLKGRYVSSVLEFNKVRIEFYNNKGKKLTGKKAESCFVSRAGYSFDKRSHSYFVRPKFFVGYRLDRTPVNATKIKPFSFEYQFLVRKRDGSGWRALRNNGIIRTDDNLKFRAWSSKPVYLYVFNIDSAGNVHVMFPNAQINYVNPLGGKRLYYFPENKDLAFRVDEITGSEEFVFMVFRRHSAAMERLIRRIKKGKLKKAGFFKNELVLRTRGVGQIRRIKTLRKKRAGFSSRKISGLPSDYKDVFRLRHE